MENKQKKTVSKTKVIIFGLIIGIILTCSSIVVGQKTAFEYCDFTPQKLHVVDRGAPFAYFKVTPSQSVCDPVDNVGAVWAINVGNDISFKHLFADWFIWSGVSAITILAISKIKGPKNSISQDSTKNTK